MKLRITLAAAAALAAAALSSPAHAFLASGDGDEQCVQAGSAPTICYALDWNHPKWASRGTWIAPEKEGVFVPNAPPTWAVHDTGVSPVTGFYRFWVLADDSASLLFTGPGAHFYVPPTRTKDTCADGPIGCEPEDILWFYAAVQQGETYTLSMEVINWGSGLDFYSNPTAANWGAIQVAEAPVPAGLALGLTAIGGLYALRRIRDRRPAG